MINSVSTTFIDPHPTDWLNSDRVGYLHDCISPLAPLLLESQLLDKLLLAWFHHEIVHEVDPLKTSELDEKLLLLQWCRKQWGHRLESLYLKNKSKLDLITFCALSVESLHLAYELYYRLKANESSFEQLSVAFSVGKERFNGGKVENISLSQFPTSMQSAFASMQIGDLHKPIKNGGKYTVLQLLNYVPASFDDESEQRLLLLQLGDWQQGMIEAVRRHLISIH